MFVAYVNIILVKFTLGFESVPACCCNRSNNHFQGKKPTNPLSLCIAHRQNTSTTAQISNELSDLFESGTLSFLPRRKDYIERRVDGYIEPEEIYILGTAHSSSQSAEDVRRVIECVRPESVVVELCRSRSGLMYPRNQRGNAFAISKAEDEPTWRAALRSAQLGGRSAMLLRFALSRFSAKSQLDSAGICQDFLAARIAADDVNAEIVLGGRPIEITLKRAMRSLTFKEKVKLLRFLFSNRKPVVNEKDIEAMRMNQSVLDEYEMLLAKEFPALHNTLITERDLYLAWSLKRSKAVCGVRRVVGIVGAGHVAGIKRNIVRDAGNLVSGSELRFQDLVRVDDKSGAKGTSIARILRGLLIETFIGGVLWLTFDSVVHKLPNCVVLLRVCQ